jgi:hypothetical protein
MDMEIDRKRLFRILAALSICAQGFGQGWVPFCNQGQNAYVSNALTRARVVAGSSFQAALYYAPDGVTTESSFIQIGSSVGFAAAGIFIGGTRTAPTPTPGGWAMLQVRVFEAAYGSSYEQALVADPQNGRRALTGKSNILRIKSVDPTVIPPPTIPCQMPGLQPFTVDISPEPPLLPQLTINDVLVFEGDSGTTNAVFTVSLIGGRHTVVTVDYATSDGTANAGSDYAATSGTVVFNPGDSSQTIVVSVYGDTIPENDETYFVNLMNPTNAVVARNQGVGTIYNDDCRTSLSAATYTGVTINGCVDKPYRIEASATGNPDSWTAVTNLVLPSSRYLWIDPDSINMTQRFYRAILLPPQ